MAAPTITRVPNRCTTIDVHEMLKLEILSQRPGPRQTVADVQVANDSGAVIPTIGFEDIELYFDSVQRNTSSNYAVGEVKWDVTVLNNTSDIRNCIEMHVGSFFFPKIYAPTTAPEYFYFRRVLVEFQNAPANQAVLAATNNRFHFEFEVQNITGQCVKLVPIKSSFFFKRPITSITDFQLRFLVPPTTPSGTFKRIPLPRDTAAVISVEASNPMQFTFTDGTTTTALGPIGVQPLPGIAVFFTGYNTTSYGGYYNPAVNSADGLFVTNIINATTFEISGVDATIGEGVFTDTATVFIPKNRFALPVRFTTSCSQITNYISINHS